MMSGLPVIASDFPLWREIIGQPAAGLLVPPNDPSALSEAIDWILRNPDRAREMGQRGRTAVERSFNWQSEAASLPSAYEFCLGTKPAHRNAIIGSTL
jgi:glycosyltransferase involved in cell wall biosynthesis